MNKFIVKPNKTLEEIAWINKKPKKRLIDESFADLQRREASFGEMQSWIEFKKHSSAKGFKY